MSTIRIVLADDHELVLEGLRSLIEAEGDLQVVATATTGEQLLEAVRRHAPDVAVLDLEMGELGGLRCLELIRERHPRVRVLVLTAYSDGESMRAALEGGAAGFALKTEPPQQTVASIRQVHRGHLVFPLAARRWLLRGGAPRSRGRSRSARRRSWRWWPRGSPTRRSPSACG
ncbi:MAG TPA: response regulator transcription factor [Longimicrobiaceae bacterium]|nr:response regulator transcription factor [Longimicrobiaceae bacterium]